MNDTRLPKIVYLLMLFMGLLEWMQVYPQLPDRMASHFDFYGRPDGWQPKEAFFLVMAVVIGVTGLIGFLLPALIAAAPAGFTELAHLPALEGKTWNHPVLAGDILLARNGQEMVAFRLSPARR